MPHQATTSTTPSASERKIARSHLPGSMEPDAYWRTSDGRWLPVVRTREWVGGVGYVTYWTPWAHQRQQGLGWNDAGFARVVEDGGAWIAPRMLEQLQREEDLRWAAFDARVKARTVVGEICPGCEGSGEGRWDGARCSTCGGSGEVAPQTAEVSA